MPSCYTTYLFIKSSKQRTPIMSTACIVNILPQLLICLLSIVLMLRIAFQARILKIYFANLVRCTPPRLEARSLPPRPCPLPQTSSHSEELSVAQTLKFQLHLRRWPYHWPPQDLLCHREGHNTLSGRAIGQRAVSNQAACGRWSKVPPIIDTLSKKSPYP